MEDYVSERFYTTVRMPTMHATADGNYSIQIREKMLGVLFNDLTPSPCHI